MLQNETATQVPRQSMIVPKWVVVIGTNSGGPQALAEVLPKFPPFLQAAIIIMQRMRLGFTRVLAEQLGHVCAMPVCEPVDGQALQGSRVYIAPGGSRLAIENVGTATMPAYSVILEDMTTSAEAARSRVDAAMESAAQAFGQYSVGVLLTGLGSDGREGMRAIASAGGVTIAQDEASSVVHDLPASVIHEGIAKDVLPLWNIADRIVEIVGGSANAVAA